VQGSQVPVKVKVWEEGCYFRGSLQPPKAHEVYHVREEYIEDEYGGQPDGVPQRKYALHRPGPFLCLVNLPVPARENLWYN
jgi:hypothetical protein